MGLRAVPATRGAGMSPPGGDEFVVRQVDAKPSWLVHPAKDIRYSFGSWQWRGEHQGSVDGSEASNLVDHRLELFAGSGQDVNDVAVGACDAQDFDDVGGVTKCLDEALAMLRGCADPNDRIDGETEAIPVDIGAVALDHPPRATVELARRTRGQSDLPPQPGS